MLPRVRACGRSQHGVTALRDDGNPLQVASGKWPAQRQVRVIKETQRSILDYGWRLTTTRRTDGPTDERTVGRSVDDRSIDWRPMLMRVVTTVRAWLVDVNGPAGPLEQAARACVRTRRAAQTGAGPATASQATSQATSRACREGARARPRPVRATWPETRRAAGRQHAPSADVCLTLVSLGRAA